MTAQTNFSEQQIGNVFKGFMRTGKIEHEDSILWGIDANKMDVAESLRMKLVLETWNQSKHGRIRPATVIQPPIVPNRPDINERLYKNSYRAALESIKSKLKQLGMSDTLKPVVISESTNTRAGAVRALIDFAVEDKAEIISVNTRAHSDHRFWHLGSFAEKLISSSPIPVLAINARTILPQKISKILFATDFSRSSRDAFKRVLDWALRHQAEVILFHKYERYYFPVDGSDFGLVMNPELQAYLIKDSEKRTHKRLWRWAELARRNHVRCEPILSIRLNPIDDEILAEAKNKKADIIVVGSHRGPIGQKFLGSVARDVLVSSTSPVIVIHEK